MPILITGGARSGKSSFAEKLLMQGGGSGVYIATCQLYDEEMKERVALHQRQREESGYCWITREEPYSLSELLRELDEQNGEQQAVLVDCLTLWLSNWLLRFEGEPDAGRLAEAKVDELVQAAASFRGRLLLVTNEVGDGIVPEYKLGRSFRDQAGRMNQRLAAVCGQVFLVTAGIPVELKQLAYRIGQQ